MKKFRRIISITLAVVLMLAILPYAGQKAEAAYSPTVIQLSTNHEGLSQPIMKIGGWLRYFFLVCFCVIIEIGRNKFDCTLEDLHPVCQRKRFALENNILSHHFVDSTSSKVRIISGKSPATLREGV